MFQIPDDFQWLYPWSPLPGNYKLNPCSLREDPLRNWNPQLGARHFSAREALVQELKRELPPGHILEGLDFVACGLFVLTHKDFLFTTNDQQKPLACVHLTFHKESQPPWPWTTVFTSLGEWQAEMNKDHQANPKPTRRRRWS